MPRFSANLSMLFTEWDPLDRPKAAADAGFDGFEVQFPYDHPPEAWAKAKDAAGIPCALFNLPAGDMLTGGPGLAAMPGREGAFAEGIAAALGYADALVPGCVNVLMGWPPAGLDRSACYATLTANLNAAAEAFAPRGIRVLTEPVNDVDRPEYFLKTSAESIELIDKSGHPNLSLQYDVYHMEIMGDDLLPTIERLLGRIGHIQFADVPGRHEPGTGGIDFPALFAGLDRMGYAGYAGAEYVPEGGTLDGLGWLYAERKRG
jgi:hydroxypyruvate isomerase